MCDGVSSFLSPHRYFTNISIGGRDYSFNGDGYLSKPLLDVIAYINGRGWEEVSARHCMLTPSSAGLRPSPGAQGAQPGRPAVLGGDGDGDGGVCSHVCVPNAGGTPETLAIMMPTTCRLTREDVKRGLSLRRVPASSLSSELSQQRLSSLSSFGSFFCHRSPLSHAGFLS